MSKNAPPGTLSIQVWDRPTRVFHWSLVVLVILGLVTSEAEGVLFWTHLAAGYGVLGLLVFRIFWGFLGTRHARFAEFLRPWSVVREHLKEMLNFTPSPAIGHTAPGGWMIAALLVVLFLLVASGLFAGDDDQLGPMAPMITAKLGAWAADAMSEVHESLNALLWTLVGVHVAGVLFVSVTTDDNLIRAMWTGRKKIPAGLAETGNDDIPAPGRLRLALSIAAGIASVLAVAL